MTAEPIFTFDETTHTYSIGNKTVPNCTSVVASGGLVPYRFVAEDLLERKRELGRETHLACHLHNLGKLGSYDPKIKSYLHAWIVFKEQTGYTPLLSEYRTVAWVNGLPFGMTIDNSGMLKGKDTIVELKIGTVLPHHAVQLAGYAAGLPHPTLRTPFARFMARKRLIVELRSSGSPKVHACEGRGDYEVFAALLHVSSWRKQFSDVYKEEQ